MRWGILLSILMLAIGGRLSAQPSEEDILNQLDPEARQKAEAELREDLEETPEEGDLGPDIFRVAIKADYGLNYVFAESPESFIINYKLNLEGTARNKIQIIKGKAHVDTDVKGFLAKWPTGGCELRISVSEVPYEMVFSKVGEDKIRLDAKIDEQITERWESNCKFTDAPRAKFNTVGNPEGWIKEAIRKSAGLLRGVKIPVDRLHKQITRVQFSVDPFLIADPPLGSAEIQGKGTIEITPES